MTGKDKTSAEAVGEDSIARLLRLGQPATEAPEILQESVRSAVRDEWHDRFANRRKQRSKLVARIAMAAIAASVAAVMSMRVIDRSSQPLTSGPIASIERLEGEIRLGGASSVAGGTRTENVSWTTVSAPGAELASGSVVETGPSSRTALRMKSGSSLRLDVDSSLRLAGLDGDEEVVELLAGGVYIDSSDHGAPITVKTVYGSARDIGTQFEVRLFTDRLRVRVREGKVQLERGVALFSASPGDELLVGFDGVVARGVVARHGVGWQWAMSIAPPFELEGETLWSYLGWVSAETGWDVRFDGEGLLAEATEMVLHGSIQGLRPDQTLEAVLPVCNLTHTFDEGTLLVERGNSRR